jgi:hypothetical protein
MGEQPNFGHHHGHAFGVHIDGWGDGPLLLRHGHREWFFEFSLMFGPVILRKRDMQPSDRQPIREDDPFWAPFQIWMKTGRKCRAVYTPRGRIKAQRKLSFWLCHVPKGVLP